MRVWPLVLLFLIYAAASEMDYQDQNLVGSQYDDLYRY